ncbi:PAS domain S-box protein [Nitrosomonas halophila]|uniref:PAS domain S-box-containing protein n=1 Tax=Nitrosomonas halophila TaxID=44576 RepID=A0A1H3M475_9PROT|nr:PAS domain S-box protein [Nitrosomonas halophila]SDY71403.1 PAS domain S-box-containing protein [Nitrosomonas halophila]
MPKRTAPPKHQTTLRHEAETRLNKGAAPSTQGWTLGKDALSMLYDLARDPAAAGDALKLLHELQVHQVELDLQHEQMEQDRNELVEALARYAELYEFAPVGYFIVDSESKIIEGNRTGARLFGVECAELSGQRIDSFLAPASGQVLRALLERLRIDSRGSCESQTRGGKAHRAACKSWQLSRPTAGIFCWLLWKHLLVRDLTSSPELLIACRHGYITVLDHGSMAELKPRGCPGTG